MDKNRIKGALWGFVLGDALGVPHEFKTAEDMQLRPVRDMVGFEMHHQPAGTWSDDTSMVLVTMEAMMTSSQEQWLETIMNNFLAWYHKGEYTPHGECFDIGGTVKSALKSYTPGRFIGPSGEYDQGNGALMRILPVALWAHLTKEWEWVKKISQLTHGHPHCTLASEHYAQTLGAILEGWRVTQAVDVATEQCPDFANTTLFECIKNRCIFQEAPPLHPSGFVVDTLECVYACAVKPTFKSGVLKAIHLGGDTDTISALTGALIGARMGFTALPREWLKQLQAKADVDDVIERFTVFLERVEKESAHGL